MTDLSIWVVIVGAVLGCVGGFGAGLYLGWDLRGEAAAARLEAVAETARQMESVALRTQQAMHTEAARYFGQHR